ncbi:alpha/beta hydrolase family protein [Arcticibacter sp. MXS-1]|uniref:alpha/beta hydrolase family protein n=1 Tax=Arcticibacter sp. MXS-1 TaxID=3341726 RepID=UPI0035A8C7F7
MKRISFCLLFTTFITLAKAQDLSGAWYGVLNLPTARLRLVLHLTKTGNAYSSTLDSPDQGAKGIPVEETLVIGNELRISAARLGLKYTATYLADSGLLKGTFNQGGLSLPLTLSRDEKKNDNKALKSKRPQDPLAFPYKQEEVEFANPKAGNKLSGTLTLPANAKASKAVILISGSGPQDRNEEIAQFNHRPFLVLSDWLTRNGIAVLRYDDRGVGKSTGSFANSTSADFADDAEAAVQYILSRPDLKNVSIGLVGHSEGGMIAPMVASRNKTVQFLVLLSAPGVPIRQLMHQQRSDQLKLMKTGDGLVQKSLGLYDKVDDLLVKNATMSQATLKPRLDSLLREGFKAYAPEELGGQPIDQAVAQTSAQMLNPWYRYFINFKPADYLSKITVPVLAITGSLDTQVKSSDNLQGIRQSLAAAGNKKAEIVEMPGLNHLLQKAITGNIVEYSQIEETIDPVALQKISSWIKHR